MIAVAEKLSSQVKDEAGKRYGRLSVLSRALSGEQGARWLCRCDCGSEATVLGKHLRNGRIHSCGCFHGNILDLASNIYGRLTVLTYMGKGMWLCQCSCGGKKTILGQSLRQGSTKSCGCIHKEGDYQRKPYGVAAFNELYGNMRGKAKVRGYKFELTEEHVRKLTSQDCTYCGKHPSQKMKKGLGLYIYNGIDRVNNNEGYVENNVVSCCKTCNYAKRTMGVDEFTVWIAQVYKYFIEGNNQ